MLFRQLFDKDTSTYTYLLADPKTREAVIIDPVAEQADRDQRLLEELGLKLVYVLETHVHADHVTGAGELRERLGVKTVISNRGGADCADVQVSDGDTIPFGRYQLEVRSTPGHTDGCVSYVVRDGEQTLVFTGDALFVRGCGRTDFQQGNPRSLYRSVHEKLYTLPDDTLVYPGHDYKGHTVTTIGEEKAHNPRLNLRISEEAFVDIMGSLQLPNPRHMDVALPANLQCGKPTARS